MAAIFQDGRHSGTQFAYCVWPEQYGDDKFIIMFGGLHNLTTVTDLGDIGVKK